jgi:hypothetical protein
MPAADMSATTVSAASMTTSSMAAAAVSASTAAGVCFKCEKRHYEEQHRDQASAGRQHRPHSVAELGAPHRRGRPSVGIPPRTKSFQY